jgi:DNA-binding transcriptional regulator GbsR (MarR family)
LLDNIDRIFENIGDDASLLREYLLNHDDIRIVGGSTRMTEHFWKYNQPFYQFFRVLELKALTAGEVRTLLLNWSEQFNIPQLKTFVETRSGQLEAIRLLTDGLPRTLQYFVNILLTNAQDTSYEYLRHVMDSVTPLYQERLNSLPSSQRKIVLQMAFIWEATGTGKLAEVTRMNNNVISAQLKQLSDKGIVEKVETGSKNHLYRLTERFFNLWLIFTQGNPGEKRRAKYLTIFLENFYDAEQIHVLAKEHLDAQDKGTLSASKAVPLTKALAQSNHIKSALREQLIAKTLQLKGIDDDIKKNKERVKDIATIYYAYSKFDEAEAFLRLGIKEGLKSAAHDLALIFYEQNINKEEALQLVAGNYEDYKDDIDFQTVSILVNVWCGNLQHLHSEVSNFVKAYPDESWAILERLLCHGQFNLVYQIFQSSETAETLRELYSPLYYACLILTQGKENIHLKIPPEIASTVSKIIQEVTSAIEYYKGTNG